MLTLTRDNIASNVSVDFATVDGTATALSDYVATTGTVNFAAGQMSQRITIPLQIEPGAQPTKSFGVILGNIRGGATLGPYANAEVRIVDTRSPRAGAGRDVRYHGAPCVTASRCLPSASSRSSSSCWSATCSSATRPVAAVATTSPPSPR